MNRAENFLDRHQKEAEIDPDGKKKGKKGKKKTKRADGTSETEKEDDDEEEKKKEAEDKLNLATSVALNEGEDFNAIIERMQRTASVQLRQSAIRKEKEEKIRQESMVQKEWSCQLSRDEIIKIWRTPRIYLKSENERKVHTLLHKYNGSYLSYLNLIEEGNKRKAKMLKEGAHIQWEKTGKLLTKDIDFRARQILREIDRAMTTKNEYIHSDVLHANDQKFPTKVLRTHLEEALDQLLIDQIKDRERADMLRIDSSDDDYDYQHEEEEEEEEEEETEGEHGRKSLRGTLSRGSASRGASRGGTTSQQGKRKKKQKKGARDVDDEFTVSDFRDDNRSKASNSSSNAAREEILAKVKKRSEKRLQRKQQLKQISEEEEILKTKKFLQLQQQKEKEMQSYSKDILKAMVDKTISQSSNFCLACRTKRCEWKSSIDYNACMKRKRELDEEIERIRLDKHNLVFTSTVALSSQLGGNTIFRRGDLLDELYSEASEIEARINLDQIDMELHDAYASKSEYFESHYLHGYSILLWTNNARTALEARQSRLVAMTVAKEIVDDILDFMLEGWIFGERQSNYHVLGYVPTIKKDGNIFAGQDQITSVTTVIARMKKRAEAKRKSIQLSEQQRGKMIEKSYEIELQSNNKKEKQKIIDNNQNLKHLLNETEQTIKFGLFMLTLMYFRAMIYLRRDKASLEGKNDLLQVGSDKKQMAKNMTSERMQMINEENRIKLRQKKMDLILAKSKIGAQRRKEREEQERREAIQKLQSIIRRQKLEIMSVTLLQKVYRGHLGRKAAKRWALKRAELGAMNALLNATAITIQRVFRGHRDRNYAILKRTEMAQFIALMRIQESQQDEEIYWQTHPWTRFKKNQKEWLQAKLEQYKSKGTLGGSRLSADEQAQLEGKTIDDIKRELEGLDEEDEVDLESELATNASSRASSRSKKRRGGGGGGGGRAGTAESYDGGRDIQSRESITSSANNSINDG